MIIDNTNLKIQIINNNSSNNKIKQIAIEMNKLKINNTLLINSEYL